MRNRVYRRKQKKVRREVLITAGVFINVILSFIMYQSGAPLFLDTVGTLAVSAVVGMFPGMVTALVTNVVCAIYNDMSPYFTIVNVLIAMFTAWYARNYSLRNIEKTALFGLFLAFFTGITSGIIQYLLLQSAQHSVVAETASALAAATNLPYILSFFLTNILLNIFDKGISIAVAVLLVLLLPAKLQEQLALGDWKQRSLTSDEISSVRKWNKDVPVSMRTRMALMLVGTALLLVVVTGWIGVRLYYSNEKNTLTQSAKGASTMAAEMLDASEMEGYLKNGEEEPGYSETEDKLLRIRDNAYGISYLYVVKIEEDGCHFIFDLDTEEEPGYEPGEVVPIEAAFEPYLEDLLAGREIDIVVAEDRLGWLLTAYTPLKDADGKTVCYVGADVEMSYLSDYMREFLLRLILILSGFFLLVVAYGIWSSERYIAYPISSMAMCVDRFAQSGNDQKKLDENVRQIRALDIRTSDELEKLYQSLCRMMMEEADQMRSIRRLSESTAKMQDGLIVTMADMVEDRDTDTGAHVQKTAAYAKLIVEGLKKKGYYPEKITPKFMSDVVRSAPLHDVGKISISDTILNKPGKLTEEEYEIMKTHTTAGKQIMESAISTVQGENYLKEARNMAAYHHERWDGTGYPEGLHGEVIPLSARIMAVADVFDALTSPRVYKPAYPLEKALAIIEEGAGTQFDPKCVEVFMDSLPEVKVILKKYSQASRQKQ